MSAQYRPNRPVPRARHALITGAPSFVAMRLIHQIAEHEPNTHITAVVKRDIVDTVEEVLARRVGIRSKVRLVIGDVAQEQLGLSPQDLEAITADVTDIFHLASLYYLGVGRRAAETVNIGGTRNALSLAECCECLERFNHYSTAFVAGSREGVILEDDLDRAQTFRNTFEETKFQAELLVRRAARTLPVSIYRPSLVVGDSHSGEIDHLDGPYYLVQLLANNPGRMRSLLAGVGHYPLNVVPIDFVVQAIQALSLNPLAEGRTFHVVDPSPIAAADAMELIAEAAGSTAPGSGRASWVGRWVSALPGIRNLVGYDSAVVDELDTLSLFNPMNTLHHLRRTDIICPPLPSYVENLVRFAQRRDAGWNLDVDEPEPL